MLEKYLRPYYQIVLVNPIAKKIQYCSFLSPSYLTLIGCFIGIISGIAIGLGWLWTGFSCLLLSGYLDTLDGTAARLKEQSSPFGSALDIVSDRVVELAVILGLYNLYPEVDGIFSLLMLGSILICVTSFLVVGIFTENTGQKSFHYSPGLMERGEAFLFFSFMIFFSASFSILAIVFSALTFFTSVLRLYQFSQWQRTS
ncbi:MAG: CDP-alcohol phosphatidyltransferase family protein [Simkaniaceae bacterium]